MKEVWVSLAGLALGWFYLRWRIARVELWRREHEIDHDDEMARRVFSSDSAQRSRVV